jgi:hypothetical protein
MAAQPLVRNDVHIIRAHGDNAVYVREFRSQLRDGPCSLNLKQHRYYSALAAFCARIHFVIGVGDRLARLFPIHLETVKSKRVQATSTSRKTSRPSS